MKPLTTIRILALATCGLPCAFGYIPYTLTSNGQTIQVTRPDFASLQYYLNNLVVAGATSSQPGAASPVITPSSNPVGAGEAAMAGWNNIGSASIHFNALSSTTLGHNSNDCTNVISIAGSSADLSILGFVSASSPGAIEVTANAIATTAGSACGGPVVPVGAIYDSDVLLNPYVQFSTDGSANTTDLQAVMAHEFGHALGMNHTGLLAATMYPYFSSGQRYQRHLSWDEKAFAATVYPSGTKALGTISGTVTLGTSPVVYGLIVATEFSGTGRIISSLTAADGTYSIQVPPGTWRVYAEPFNSFVGPVNIYSVASGSLAQGTTQATTGYQATFSGGNLLSAVNTFTVTAGSTSSNGNISVISGATPLGAPYYAIVPAGGSGSTQFLVGGAVSMAAGQSYDFLFAGAGIDSTVVPNFIGTNVNLVGLPTVTGFTVNGNPVIRQTLSVGTPQTNVTMGTMWILKGTNVLPFSGVLNIEPMAPTVNSVSDAESARASFTSGQWAAVYGNNLANGSGSWNANTDFTGGVCAGCPLPSNLGGVSVTVNGSPASIYYVSPTQINFLTPSGLPTTGTVNVVASNFGTPSASFSVPVAQASPSFFYYPGGGNIYPAAVHLAAPYNLIGDPTVVPGTERAHPGETIAMYCNGLAASTGGVIVAATQFPQTVTVTAGTTPLTVSAPYLVAAGEFQINVTIPSTLAAGTYTLTMTVPGGSTTGSGITVLLPVGQ